MPGGELLNLKQSAASTVDISTTGRLTALTQT
jgi:hypothetical protein